MNETKKPGASATEAPKPEASGSNVGMWIGAGVGAGVGSAALAAALLYATRTGKKRSQPKS